VSDEREFKTGTALKENEERIGRFVERAVKLRMEGRLRIVTASDIKKNEKKKLKGEKNRRIATPRDLTRL